MKAYDNLVIIYYSGTGNAKRVSEWLAKEASAQGIRSYVFSYYEYLNQSLPELTGKTLIGFCSATHGFNLPHSFLKVLIKFRKYRGSDVFIVNTRAGMKLGRLFLPGLSGMAQYFPAIILMLKGYKVIAMRPVDLPSNWISLHPGLKQKVVDSLSTHWKIKIQDFARIIFQGKKTYFHAFISLPFDLLITPIALGYYFIGRFIIAKTFVASDLCNNCGICVSSCPTQSIKWVDNRPYWLHTCESCMHCINTCPKKAIETAHGFLLIVILILSLFVNPWITNMGVKLSLKIIPDFIEVGSAILYILKCFVNILLFIALYHILHYGMRFTWFNRLVIYTSLTKFSFWRRYKGPKA